MELKNLRLRSFLSHEDTTVEFTPNRKLLIDGVSGAGKTAIVEAIVWVLFGRGRSDNRGLLKKGKKKATVDLSLVSDNKEYVIRRSVSEKGVQSIEISLAVDGKAAAVPATSIKEKQRFIERDILKSSYELFVNAVVWPQDNSSSFVRQTAAVRKELLLEIVGTGAFDEYYDKAKEKLSAISMARAGAESELKFGAEAVAQDIKDVAEFDAVPVDSASMATAMLNAASFHKRVDERIAILRSEMPVLQKKVSDRRLNETLRKSYLEEKQRISAGVHTAALAEDVDRLRLQLDKITTDKVMHLVIKKAQEQNAETEKKRAALEADKAYSQTTIEINKTMMASMAAELSAAVPEDSLCPTTGNICVRAKELIEHRKAEIAKNMVTTSDTIATHTKRIEERDKELAGLELIPVDLNRLRDLEASICLESMISVDLSKAQELISRLEAIETNLAGLPEIPDMGEEALLAEYEKEISKCLEESSTNKTLEATLKGQLAVYEQKREVAMKKRIRIGEYEARAAELRKELEKTGTDLENLTLVKDALGSNGIKVVIVDTVLPKLELRINEVLSELTDFRVKLDTQKPSASDPDKMVEGLFITVINGEGEDIDFDGFSGGEKLKISVAITEALAELQNSSFRILDEMIVGLDAESVGQFTEILLKLQSRFSQIIAISHLPEVKQLFDDKITVTKKNGTSTAT